MHITICVEANTAQGEAQFQDTHLNAVFFYTHKPRW